MTRPPPYLVRRLVIAPLVVLACATALLTLPLWLVIAAFASRYVPGRWRPLRVTWFLLVYLTMEALMLLVLFVAWIASGFGWKLRSPRFEEIHYRLAAWWLRRVMGSARRTFDLEIEAGERLGTVAPDRPLLVFSRHAGPGDSFLLVDKLLNDDDRRPRIILKDLLRLDPCVDVALSRLPNRFVPTTGKAGEEVVAAITDLAAGMGPTGAIVLFPEGGNFTEARRRRSIDRLDEIGRPGLAERARGMEYMLPPKPTGVRTAIAAAPDADVVFIGHVGLEQLTTIGDLWRGIPMDARIETRVWAVPAEAIPPPDQQETWLYDQWQEIDDWIGTTLAERARSAD